MACSVIREVRVKYGFFYRRLSRFCARISPVICQYYRLSLAVNFYRLEHTVFFFFSFLFTPMKWREMHAGLYIWKSVRVWTPCLIPSANIFLPKTLVEKSAAILMDCNFVHCRQSHVVSLRVTPGLVTPPVGRWGRPERRPRPWWPKHTLQNNELSQSSVQNFPGLFYAKRDASTISKFIFYPFFTKCVF